MAACTLVIGNKNYSSWSMRAWLMLRWLGIPFEEIVVRLYRADSREALLRYSPAAKVPVLLDGDLTIWDTLAIAGHLSETHPNLWPSDRRQRAFAKSVCAEMHSSFSSLRGAMSYNARGRNREIPIDPETIEDINRVQDIWAEGRTKFAGAGRYLLGEFGIADIMFAPVAARFRTYRVEVRPNLEDYWNALLDHPLCREWFAAGAAEDEIISVCELGLAPMPRREGA